MYAKRSFAYQHFVNENTKSPPINSTGVTAALNDFWSNIFCNGWTCQRKMQRWFGWTWGLPSVPTKLFVRKLFTQLRVSMDGGCRWNEWATGMHMQVSNTTRYLIRRGWFYDTGVARRMRSLAKVEICQHDVATLVEQNIWSRDYSLSVAILNDLK